MEFSVATFMTDAEASKAPVQAQDRIRAMPHARSGWLSHLRGPQ
jgi:malate synthase